MTYSLRASSKGNPNEFPTWAVGLLTAILLSLGMFWSVSSVKAWTHDSRIEDQDKRLQRIEEKIDKLLDQRQSRRPS